MRVVNGLPDAHFLQVVLKLFAAVQADHVALAARLARLGDRGQRPGKAAMRATEQQIQNIVDHGNLQSWGKSPASILAGEIVGAEDHDPPSSGSSRSAAAFI